MRGYSSSGTTYIKQDWQDDLRILSENMEDVYNKDQKDTVRGYSVSGTTHIEQDLKDELRILKEKIDNVYRKEILKEYGAHIDTLKEHGTDINTANQYGYKGETVELVTERNAVDCVTEKDRVKEHPTENDMKI